MALMVKMSKVITDTLSGFQMIHRIIESVSCKSPLIVSPTPPFQREGD